MVKAATHLCECRTHILKSIFSIWALLFLLALSLKSVITGVTNSKSILNKETNKNIVCSKKTKITTLLQNPQWPKIRVA